MVEYKDRLQRAMNLRGVGKQELADAIGISYQAVRKAVLGLSGAFNAENNAKAAAHLRVSPDWLAANIGDMETGAAPVTQTDAQSAFSSSWPFSPDLLSQVLALDEAGRQQVEGALRLVLAQLQAGTNLVGKVA